MNGNGVSKRIPGIHFILQPGKDELFQNTVEDPLRQNGLPGFDDFRHAIWVPHIPLAAKTKETSKAVLYHWDCRSAIRGSPDCQPYARSPYVPHDTIKRIQTSIIIALLVGLIHDSQQISPFEHSDDAMSRCLQWFPTLKLSFHLKDVTARINKSWST